MNKSTKARLVRLNAQLGKTTEFIARNPDDEDHTLRNTAVGVGALGAAGAAGVYLRGRHAIKASNLPVGPDGGPGILDTLRVGGSALKGDAISGYHGAKAAINQGASSVAGQGLKLAGQAKGFYSDAAVAAKKAAAATRESVGKAIIRTQGRAAMLRKGL